MRFNFYEMFWVRHCQVSVLASCQCEHLSADLTTCHQWISEKYDIWKNTLQDNCFWSIPSWGDLKSRGVTMSWITGIPIIMDVNWSLWMPRTRVTLTFSDLCFSCGCWNLMQTPHSQNVRSNKMAEIMPQTPTCTEAWGDKSDMIIDYSTHNTDVIFLR